MNDNQAITDRGINALAAFIAEHREWDAPGVAAALRAERDGDVWQLAQRMIRRASIAANTTPRLQGFDTADLVGCRRHPGAPVRTDGDCGRCFAERRAVPDEAGPRPDVERAHPLRAAVARVAPDARCPAYATERGVVLDCVLPNGHDGSHCPGDMDGARALMRDEVARAERPEAESA